MHFIESKGLLASGGRMNIYRGCTHGCIYCDSRSKCYQFTHDFEDIEVKINAPELLENALRSKRTKCMIGTGSMCDPYMHCEDDLRLTRRCIEIIDKYGFGLSLQTKSSKVLRDIDLFESINRKSKCVIQMTMTTHDEKLCRILEPHVSTTRERFEALKTLNDRGIPTIVWLCPLLPFINDTEENLRGILEYCFEAKVRGILCFNIGVTLRDGDREYFYAALDRYFPGLKQKYIHKYGLSYEVISDNNDRLMKIFHEECEKHGVLHNIHDIFAYAHEFPEPEDDQLTLF